MKVIDVVGAKPTPAAPELAIPLAELGGLMGLESVKEQAAKLVKLATENYERELRGEEPDLIPLNRLFLGNPGTGKTTVAQIYGRILKGLGYLTDGGLVLTTPSKDWIGSAVGAAEENAKKVFERSAGKVLVIDEAYGLHANQTYGPAAINAIVEHTHNKPGDDIAVLMLGYEEDMMKMLRESNDGLKSRFAPEQAFRFEDFTDCLLYTSPSPRDS